MLKIVPLVKLDVLVFSALSYGVYGTLYIRACVIIRICI